MAVAQFEEKQYETAANIELALQQAAVFAAGQVLEAIVGYDVAANPPSNAPIWQLIGAGAPSGIQLVPNLWQRARVQPQAADLPSSYISLVLQYKRPNYLDTTNSLQWHLWNAAYYRFKVTSHQQATLLNLEQQMAGRALVRYASPVFWEYPVLQGFQATHDVLDESNYVAPSAIGGHLYWTYNAAGTGGIPNPMTGKVKGKKSSTLWSLVKGGDGRRKKENLLEHLRGLAVGANIPLVTDNTAPPWLTSISQQFAINLQRRQAVFDTIRLAESVGRAGATWFVFDQDHPDT